MPGQAWTAGPFRGWPCSKKEESEFIQQAKLEAEDRKTVTQVERSDFLALTVCLREGAEYKEVREFLPGLEPGAMVYAYDIIDKRRIESLQRWYSLIEKPTILSLEKNATAASLLFPVAIGRINRFVVETRHEEGLADVIKKLNERFKEETRYTREVEHELTRPQHSTKRKLRLGEELYHPRKDCLWLSPFYLPRRVCDLSPNRVSSLTSGSKEPQ